MQKLISQFKYRLHQHYLRYETPGEGRANLPNHDLWNDRPESDWHWLCDKVYTAVDFIKVSKINAVNRNQQKYHHKGGARPFIQHAKKDHRDGKPLSLLDNWENLHKDGENWINDVAKEKHEEMKQMKNIVREKMIQEAPDGTLPDSIVVDVDSELRIMGEKLGRKGKSIRGVGVFPCMEVSNSYVTSSMATNTELNEMQGQIKQLSTHVLTLQKENEELKEQMMAFTAASQERQQSRVHQDNPYYDELGHFNLDDNLGS
ncbi:hypothetical protein LguiA_002824 [Lonicera macranthoides]